jgi:hypothetical protein
MNNNIVDIKDRKTLTRLLRNCYYVYGWVMLNEHDGKYIKLQKTDLMSNLLDCDFDLSKFGYDTKENIIYIN